MTGRVRRDGPVRVVGVLLALTLLPGCTGRASSTTSAPSAHALTGMRTLTFATADFGPADAAFIQRVHALSGGRLAIRTETYDGDSTHADVDILRDLKSGRLTVADIGSRAFENVDVKAFRAFQEPFLVTSRSLLNRAVTGSVSTVLLKSLRPTGLTGLAIVPRSVRYLYSTRPLTTPDQFRGATIQINESATTSEVLTALGAKPVTDIRSGLAVAAALRSGKLTAVESDVQLAVKNGYVSAAPYVSVNAPLFAQTSTIAESNAALAKLPAEATGWLRMAAADAAAAETSATQDRVSWAAACAQALRPQLVTPAQLDVLHSAEATTYADLSADQDTTLAIDRIARLAATTARLDPWARCGSPHAVGSATKVLDGTYRTSISHADVVAGGDCATCGNNGEYTFIIHDGRYAIIHAYPRDADHNEPSVSFFDPWLGGDPIDVGTVTLHGSRATIVAEVQQQFGASGPVVYAFEVFRGRLTWTAVSGPSWEPFTAHPWTSAG